MHWIPRPRTIKGKISQISRGENMLTEASGLPLVFVVGQRSVCCKILRLIWAANLHVESLSVSSKVFSAPASCIICHYGTTGLKWECESSGSWAQLLWQGMRDGCPRNYTLVRLTDHSAFGGLIAYGIGHIKSSIPR